MAEDTVDVPVEQEARMLGWVPREEFRGAEDAWIDAETFVEKGRHILPIVQKNNERLVKQIANLENRLSQVDGALKSANTIIETLQESHADDVKAQVEAARSELKAQLATANEAGDHQGVADLTDKLIQLNAADKKAGGEGERKTPANGDAQPDAMDNPEIRTWFSENPSFVSDPRKIALAGVIMHELRMKGDSRTGKAILDAVAAEVEIALGDSRNPRQDSKVGSSNGGSGRSGNGAKSYADLPADARAACDKMADKLVGPNRAHKDVASWRAKYAEKYFAGGA